MSTFSLTQAAREQVTAELDSCKDEVQGLISRINEAQRAVGDAEERDHRLHTMWHEKVFKPRDSLLTSMLDESPHVRTLYNLALAALLMFYLQILATELVEHGRLADLSLFTWAFSGVGQVVLPAWMAMAAASLLVVPFVQVGAGQGWSWRLWVPVYAAFQLSMYAFSIWVCLTSGLAVPAALIVSVEQTRMSLKVHAYLREKLLHGRARKEVAAALAHVRDKGAPPPPESGVPDDGGLSAYPFEVVPGSPAAYALWIPAWARARGVTLLHVEPPTITIEDVSTEVGRFLYFFAAPTLVYRDAYPRSGPHVDWVQAGVHLGEFLGIIAYCYVLTTSFVIPAFGSTPSEPGDMKSFVRSLFSSMAPGLLLLVLMFFGVLHVWLNLFGTLLRHADRRFYGPWWSTSNFAAYYRQWNMVVGEWIKAYLYHDVERFSSGRVTKGWAMAFVFVFSSIVHEVIISAATGFWYPALLLLFGGPGTAFVKLQGKSNNVFMWAMLSAGTALLLVLYSREFYARNAQPPVVEPWEYGVITPLLPYSLMAYLKVS